MATRYKVIAPDKSFNGKTCGVRFQDGLAIFDDTSLKEISKVEKPAKDVAAELKRDFGYKVEELKEK